ncbi:MAG: hypothetical protein PHW86_06315 [Candidatus Bipolaricaulis sp.]|nr:hypothetical protein [Candidatus Bipolaricaulis sp.]
MKRLAIGLLLTSLLLSAGALTAGAVPLFEDPNIVWSSTVDGTIGWLLVVNTSDVVYNTLILEATTPILLEDAECYIYSGGQIVVSGLSDYMGQMADTFYRINLPYSVGFMDFVILKITSEYEQPINLFQATFKNY